MAIRTITAYNSGGSGNMFHGDSFSYSSNCTNTGIVYNSTPKSATITLQVRFIDTQYSYYFDVYIGGTKVAETVELWSEYDDYGAYTTVTRTYDLEYLEPEILTATGAIKLKVYNNGQDPDNEELMTANLRSGTVEIEVEYGSSATLGNPGTPTIKENYNGTYTASWSAASASGGSGNVYYQWWDVNNGGWWTNWSTATQVTLNVPSYGHPYEFRVRATYDGASSSSAGSLESWSDTVTKTFTAPSVTKPGAPTITQNSDGTFKASWTKATGSSGSGSVSYQLYYGNTAIGSSTTGTSVTANIPGYGTAYSFTVKATYSGATATSNATSYTFVAPSLTAPGTPTVTNDTSKYTVTWTAATGKNGVGSVYYRIITTKTDGSYVDTSNWQTALTYTANIPSNGTFSIAVEATYNNASSTSAGTLSALSNAVQKTMAAGSLTAPGTPVITENYDGTFTAKWTAATGSGNSGSVYYRLYNVTDNTYATSRITSLTATVNVPAYGVAKKYRVYATYGGASASINGAFTTSSSDTTVTFNAATLATPGAPTITQNANGTFTASWSAATGSYGVGNVYYQLINDSTGVAIGNRITERTATYNITDYNVDTVYKIKATYNGATATADGALVKTSSGTTKTFLPPVLSTPVLSLAATSGNSASLSWTAATLSNATGTVNYTIIAGNETVATTDKTTYTINEAIIAALSPAVLKIQATATNLSNTASGSVLTTTSNTAIFTYVNELVGASNLKVTGTNVANLTWTAGSTSYGTIVYDIYLAGTVVASNLSATTTSYTIPEKTVCKKTNAAIYILTRETNSGEQATSNSVNFTYSPSYTAPSGLKTNGSGSQAIVSWTAGTTTYGTMKYDVYANGTKIASDLTSNSYTILESALASMSKTVTIYITYKVTETGVSGQLSSVSFTYTPSVIKHTVGYRQGGRNHNCLVYVCVNGAWVKCAPYIYTNGKWQICSTT